MGQVGCSESKQRPARQSRSNVDPAYLSKLPAASELQGNVFVQRGMQWTRGIGFASAHFLSEDGSGSYINYSSAPTSTLDNGEKVPEQMPFTQTSYDAATRTFNGCVDWKDRALEGSSMANYRLVFSEGFSHIESGEVTMLDKQGNIMQTQYFGQCDPEVEGATQKLDYVRITKAFDKQEKEQIAQQKKHDEQRRELKLAQLQGLAPVGLLAV